MRMSWTHGPAYAAEGGSGTGGSGDGGAGGSPGGGPGAGAGGGAPAPWYQGIAGFDADVIGHAQNKGWLPAKAEEAPAALAKAVQAHREAQKMIGVPADKVLRIPEASASSAELDAYWQRIGAPKEAKDIDWTGVKTASGDPIDPKLAERLTATAVTARVPKEALLAVARDVVKHMDEERSTSAALLAASVAEQKAWLDKNWPASTRDANLFVANQALMKLAGAAGLTTDQGKAAWDAISKVGGIGAAHAMEMLRTVGMRMGEGKFVELGGGGGGGGGPMTVEAARDEIAMLKKDDSFAKKLHAGGKDENLKWRALHKIAYGTAA